MRYAFMAAEMRELDRHTIEDLGVPGLVLMERAALAVADAAEELYAENMANAPVIAVCGTGNNGGDGAAAARILLGRGIPAEIVLIGNRESLSKDMEAQLSMAENFGVPVYSGSIRLSANAAVYIDALFGIGLGREVRGDFAAAIRIMNEAKGKVVAADIPSGISADTGQVLGTAVRADVTVTMQCGKPGLFLDPGRQYAGEVRIRDIGIWSQFCSRTDGILRFAQNERRTGFFASLRMTDELMKIVLKKTGFFASLRMTGGLMKIVLKRTRFFASLRMTGILKRTGCRQGLFASWKKATFLRFFRGVSLPETRERLGRFCSSRVRRTWRGRRFLLRGRCSRPGPVW